MTADPTVIRHGRIPLFINLRKYFTLMTEIGQTVDFNHVCYAANVTPEGFWGGILVNDRDNSLILIQNEDRSKPSKYPNYWDENVIGLLHYCGTNKHQSKNIPAQNLKVAENKILNEGSRPIFVYLRIKASKYIFLGEFIRVPKYDDEIEYDGKIMYRFGLISSNISAIRHIVMNLINKGQDNAPPDADNRSDREL